MSVYLYRLARFAFRRRRWVLGVWLAVVVGTIALGVASGGKTNDALTIPGTESQQATDVLQATVPAFSGGQTQIVFAVTGTHKITDPAYEAAIEASVAKLRTVPQVAVVGDPFKARSISPDGRVALGTVQFAAQPTDVTDASLSALQAAVVPAQHAGVEVDYSGSVYPGWRTTLSPIPELVGLVIALVVLLISLGAITAAGLPILGGIVGVAVVEMSITALAAVVNVASASTTVATLLGLSCGIDYGLFILSRHRNNLLNGVDPEESVGLAAGTAGSSVVFAGLTVMIALCGLSVVGIPFLTTMGLAAAGSVLVALLVALTLLPALLGFAGHRITRFIRTQFTRSDHARRVAVTAATEPERTFGARWARFVVRHRVPVLVLGVAVLGVLALPATKMQLGLPSGASKPTSDTSRRAYDITTASFGPGFNGPLLIVVEHATSPSDGTRIATALAKVPDVASVTPLADQHDTAVVRLYPRSGPNDGATANLVRYIRNNRAAIEGDTGTHILVGGTTASNIDVSDKLSSALPIFLVVVIGLAFVLLTFAFRTILVPIKSILGFLLSIAVAFGTEVAAFQWGWGRSLFGISPSETLSFLPLIALAIIFGLSSDYEVFVVSRIKEEFAKGEEAVDAVRRGTGMSARVVTSAALIMFSIFASIVFVKDPTTKAIGFCFAVGVFVDAFVVRLTLVPAVMALVKGRFWYHPRWFARYVPDPDIEGERLENRLADTAAR